MTNRAEIDALNSEPPEDTGDLREAVVAALSHGRWKKDTSEDVADAILNLVADRLDEWAVHAYGEGTDELEEAAMRIRP